MHSMKVTEDITVHHDGDYSGDLMFVMPESAIEESMFEGKKLITIPHEAWLPVMAEYIRHTMIENIESMTDESIIDMVTYGPTDAMRSVPADILPRSSGSDLHKRYK